MDNIKDASIQNYLDVLNEVCHELRSPLSGICAVADLLQQSEYKSGQNEYITILKDLSVYMADIG